jgi:hypothetical protein
MAAEVDPMVGNWYQHLDKGQRFEVIAVDEEEGMVEIQTFDGTLEQFDLDTWYEMDLEPIEIPEDWVGPLDDVERDDMGYTEVNMEPDNSSQSSEELEWTETDSEVRVGERDSDNLAEWSWKEDNEDV